MRVTAFEVRHATWIRLALILCAFATYAFDPDDVVWRFIRELPSRRLLEHIAFAIATLLIGMGAVLCTRAEWIGESRGSRLLGEFLYAVGLASLAPVWGAVVLVVGESIRVLRLGPAESGIGEAIAKAVSLARAVRRQIAKWGVLATMVAFTITLIDRVADYGIVASAVVWVALNAPTRAGGARALR